MRRFSLSFLFMLIGYAMLFAQGTGGRLSGTVSGPDGLLPGAKVVVTDNSSNREYTVVTNDSGFYVVPQLEFGTYTVKITANGFKTLVGNEQKIDVGRDATFNAVLEVGDVSAEVVVTAGVDVITANTAQVSNTISAQQILTLPLITRSPLSLTLLQAGTSSNGATAINGMRTSMTNITRDGINIQDPFIRSNATDFAPGRPTVDDTAEFTLTTSNQEADQGSGSAQLRLVTPRGTKDLHGALFAYNRNSGFAANSFFNNRSRNADGSTNHALADKPSFRNRFQYGGKVSGPLWLPAFGEGGPRLWKDKAVFFFSYEGIKDPVSAAATRTILTPSAQSGAFRYQRTNSTSVTPFCPSQTVGSVCEIPNFLSYARGVLGTSIPSTIDPTIQSRILSQLPTVSNFTGGDAVIIGGVTTPLNTAGYRLLRRSDQTRNQYGTRVDVDPNETNSFLFVYNYNREVNLRTDVDSTGFSPVPTGEQSSENTQYTAAYRRVFSQNVVNEVRGGLFKSDVPFYRTVDPLPFYLSIPLVTNPENNFQDQGRSSKIWNFQSNGDWIHGKHGFKFGGQLQFYNVNPYNDAGNVPTVVVGTSSSTPSFADFNSIGGISTTQLGTANAMLGLFAGIVNSSSQTFTLPDIATGFQPVRFTEPYRHGAHSLYFADRWQIHPQLTLSLGVRWELYPALKIANGVALEALMADPDNPLPSLLDRNGSYVQVGHNSGQENAFYKTKYDQFLPNLGFAWSPTFESGLGKLLFGNRTVIRGGYSQALGNDSIITSIGNAYVQNAGLAATTSTRPSQNARLSANDFLLPVAPTFIPPPRTYLQNNTSSFGFFGTIFSIDPNIEATKVTQYSLGVQREFGGNTAVEVRYVGTRSDNLVRTIDYNQVDIRDNGFAADFNRALNNLRINTTERTSRINTCVAGGGTTASCTTLINTQLPNSAQFNPALTGSQQLTVLPLMPLANSRLGSLPGQLVNGSLQQINATIASLINNGTPADLALSYIQNANTANTTINWNNHPNAQNPNAVPFINFLPNPASGVINILGNGGWYRYNSLQVEVRRRFSQGLYFQANYTFSKNIGNTQQGNGNQTLVEPFLDNRSPDLVVARQDFDQTHAFNFNGVYQLPFGQGKPFINKSGWVDRIVGGWELSGLVSWNSGVPITFIDTRGTLNRTGRSGRQTANTSLTYSQIDDLLGYYEQNGLIYWIDPSILCSNGAGALSFGADPATCPQAAFTVNNPGQTGTMGRAVVNAPAFFNIDMALLKNIRIRESMRFQFRVEAFNALNHANFFPGASIQSVTSTSFGQITSANGGRTIQLAARFEW